MLLHPDTAHTGGPNYNIICDHHLRIMIYFRIKSMGYRLSQDGMGLDIPESWEQVIAHQCEDMYYDLPGFKE